MYTCLYSVNKDGSISHCFREGHKKDAEILLNHGADVELPDNYGQSPLFMACWKGKICNVEGGNLFYPEKVVEHPC